MLIPNLGSELAFRVRKRLLGYALGMHVYETHVELTSGGADAVGFKLLSILSYSQSNNQFQLADRGMTSWQACSCILNDH